MAEQNTLETDPSLIVTTGSGPVKGADDGLVRAWKGVRYAAPPVGELRWRSPRPPEPWTEIVDATEYGAVSPQPANAIIDLSAGAVQSEDCLTLNVFAPTASESPEPRPVMVWLHGGAYIFGASSQRMFDAHHFVTRGDVIVVTVNYRVGALGFLDLSSFDSGEHVFDSNLALRDVLLALNWVQQNIAAFGGDPKNVTLFGESAGGGLVTTLMTTPSSEGLFARAIAESSPATSVYDTARAATVAQMFLDTVSITATAVARLRELPVEQIVDAGFAVYREVPTEYPGTLAFAPIVDGDLVPDYPVTRFRDGLAHPVPLIIGTNKDEAGLFKLMKSPLMPIQSETIMKMFAGIAAEHPELTLPSEAQVGSAYSGLSLKAKGLGVARDVGFRMPTLWLAEGHSRVAPVYLYRFDWATPMLRLLGIGATHATELPYLWGNLVSGPKDITFKLGGLSTGKAISERMQTRWLTFAVDGVPNGPHGEPEWPRYETGADGAGERATLVIDKRDSVVDDLDREVRLAWGDEVLSFL
ncbi:carboxylesterase/lipase family protein [Leifsonia sp. H3M29-4]|uniref:carboxylesterase/lipase family protein n=1 Tax=Salinibacterium metalliresistens TaxID=3031321 RepID=UPI0023DCD232|nr:carboxylesterase/lipase family protein [Salinibacterium metalliresistens]MDF1478988.1 carboxylesterase/lipase family protein [Salinibacterium metalliresistens]